MRIGVVTPDLHRTGGTERGAAELVARLVPEHQVCLFANHWERNGAPNLCYHHVPVLPWPGLVRFYSFYAGATRAVEAAARRHGGFDVIYSPGPNCAQVEVCTAWFCQARQHELLSSGQLRPRPVTVREWLQLAHRRMYASLLTRLERGFYLSAGLKRVVSPAEILKRDLVECYGIDPQRIVVGHSGVDRSVFHAGARNALRPRARAELELRESEFAFLFVGTDWVRKGLLTVFAALAEVPDCLLLVVGAESRAAYRRRCVELGIPSRVRFLPRRPDILYYYAAGDALVAPSVYEPFGLIPLEAMACGMPAVITRQMGVAELVGAEDALILDDPTSAAELALAMRVLASDLNLRARLAANGIRRAAAHSWDGMCDVTIKELVAVAGEKSAQQNQ
jgi:glycosyltransferase involved in cell wall biosynthesis